MFSGADGGLVKATSVGFIVILLVACAIISLLLIGFGLHAFFTGTMAVYGMEELNPRTARILGLAGMATGIAMILSCMVFMEVFLPDK